MKIPVLPLALTTGLYLLAVCGLERITAVLNAPAAQAATAASFASEPLKDVVAQYSHFRRMTAKPYDVNPVISALCRGMLPNEEKAQRAQHGPHAFAQIHVYANQVGVQALTQQHSPYPVGTVLIKEKLDGQTTHSLGGMRKREAGYDSAHGDWEYFYRTSDGQLSSGKMTNCIQCHAQVSQQDYVFKKWMKP